MIRRTFRAIRKACRAVRRTFRLKRRVRRADGKVSRIVRRTFRTTREAAARAPSLEWRTPALESRTDGGPPMASANWHYIPRPDGDFTAWVNNYVEAVHTFYEAQGLDTSLLKPLDTAFLAWSASYPAHIAAQQQAEGRRAAKDEARAALEQAVRPVANFVQGYPATTDADRAQIGITVKDTTRTPTPTPTSAPSVQVESPARLTHRLTFNDTATPTRRAKPPGTLGAEVWLALVPPNQPAPRPGAGYTFLSVSSRNNLETTFPLEQAGQQAYYLLRWVSTRGGKGPWSEVCGATVAA